MTCFRLKISIFKRKILEKEAKKVEEANFKMKYRLMTKNEGFKSGFMWFKISRILAKTH